MAATMKIDQAGLPAGASGKARSDGLDTGALVTLSSVGGGTTHEFRLLWVPDADGTAVASLTQTTPTTWTFSPDAGVYGFYRIELIVDSGLTTESRQIRWFGIRTPGLGLCMPPLNGLASAAATLLNSGADQIDASEFNEDLAGGPFAAGCYGGWYPEIRLMAEAIEAAKSFLVGATNQVVSTLGSEVIVGGFVLDGSAGSAVKTFRALGELTSLVANVDVLLYDRGPPGTPVAGTLRSTLNITTFNNPQTVTQALTAVASPGVDADEIFNTARMYELRVIINAGVGGNTFRLHWAGVEIGG